MQRERAEAPAGDLLLDLAAGADEDRGGPSLVDGDARAGDLRARRAAQQHDLAPRVHDGDHDAVAALERMPLGGGDHGLGAGVVDDLAGADDGHGSGSLEGDGPDRVVGGDQQAVAGEGEVDGAGEVDLAQQRAGGGEDEQAGSARGVDVAAPVGLQPVRDSRARSSRTGGGWRARGRGRRRRRRSCTRSLSPT